MKETIAIKIIMSNNIANGPRKDKSFSINGRISAGVFNPYLIQKERLQNQENKNNMSIKMVFDFIKFTHLLRIILHPLFSFQKQGVCLIRLMLMALCFLYLNMLGKMRRLWAIHHLIPLPHFGLRILLRK